MRSVCVETILRLHSRRGAGTGVGHPNPLAILAPYSYIQRGRGTIGRYTDSATRDTVFCLDRRAGKGVLSRRMARRVVEARAAPVGSEADPRLGGRDGESGEGGRRGFLLDVARIAHVSPESPGGTGVGAGEKESHRRSRIVNRGERVRRMTREMGHGVPNRPTTR